MSLGYGRGRSIMRTDGDAEAGTPSYLFKHVSELGKSARLGWGILESIRSWGTEAQADKFERMAQERADAYDSALSDVLCWIEEVRGVLGETYADVLERRYVDAETWASVGAAHGLKAGGARDVAMRALRWMDSRSHQNALEGPTA